MARARNIKPSFFVNEDLIDLPMATRMLFIGLWTLADREGRLEDRPRRIKLSIFPGDDVDVDAALNQLNDAGFVIRYTVGGEKYVQINKFNKHQNPHSREAQSEIPPPPSADKTNVLGNTKEKPRHDQGTTKAMPSLEKVEASPADSPIPHPESPSLIPDSGFRNPDSKHTVHSADADAPPAKADAPKNTNNRYEYPEDFERLWALYPNRDGPNPKRSAFQCWNARRKEGCTEDQIENGLRRYAQWLKGKGMLNTDKVMQARTFLGPDYHFDQPFNPPRSKNEQAADEAKRLFEQSRGRQP